MSPFEYVIVLISIILGLGITTILTGVAELIKQTKLSSLYTPYIIWIALVFVLHFQDWWLSYQWKSLEVWELHSFLLIVLYPINLYILAHLLFPAGLSPTFDSKQFYIDHYPRLFISAIILIILSTIQNITFEGYTFVTQIPKFIVLAILLIIILTKNKNGSVHMTLSICLLIIIIVGLVIDQEHLIIR
jgi:hypothetical protein